MTPDFRAMCAELLVLAEESPSYRVQAKEAVQLIDRARALLAEADGPAVPVLPDDALIIEPAEYTLLVPVAQPVPVSERLPVPEDCDEQGRCWLGGHQMGNGTPTWLLGYPAWAERFPDVHRFWLPANALPLPPRGHQ